MRLFKLLLLLAAILFAACHSQSFKDGASAQSGKAAGDSLPLVTDDGIGRLVLGTPLVNCLTAGGRLAPTADTLAYGFYNHVAVELTDEEGGTHAYFVLYDDAEKMAVLDCYMELGYRQSWSELKVERIFVCSPRLRFANGVHVGMSAQELVEKHGADILYDVECMECNPLTFSVPGMAPNVSLEGTAKKVNEEKINATEYGEVLNVLLLQLSDVEDCKLSSIVIEPKSEIL